MPPKRFAGLVSGARLVALSLALLGCGAANEAEPTTSVQASGSDAPLHQWRLPNELREISGLAVSPDGRLFAHNDEFAIIYEIDTSSGRVVGSFGVGTPERGDFEGLAITPDGAFWLTTSDGQVLRFNAGDNGARVPFEQFDSGLRETCEIEGLAYLEGEQNLIFACKENHERAMRRTIAFYAWSPGGDAATLWRSVPESEIVDAVEARRFRPSSIEFDPERERWLVLSAFQPVLAEFDNAGNLRSARRLHSDHIQAEGLTVLPDGSLVIADEGGDGRAMLSIYAPGS